MSEKEGLRRWLTVIEGRVRRLDRLDARWDTGRAYEAGVLFVYINRRKEQ